MRRFLLYLVITTGALIMLLPLVWMVSTSLKPPEEVFTYPIRWIPENIRWMNFVDVFTVIPLARYFFNSILVSTTVMVGNLFFCTLAGLSLAKYNYPGKDIIFVLVLGTMMIPVQMIFLPLFLVVKVLGLVNTYGALILPNIINPMGVFLMRQMIMDVPQDLMDSARIDGASEWTIYWKMILPIIKPPMAALAIFIFVWTWNAFLWPMISTSSKELFTLPVGLSAFQDMYGTQYNLLMAGMVVSTAPIVTLFLFLQKQFIKGLTFSGLKG
ncbi:MAG: carbohydrate ABC transporter permease [Firmicutes bacterium]|nr:carbohydrate ABC transporter permease [Bacillota bacterium]